MANPVKIEVIKDTATPRLRALVQDFQSRPFFGALGKRLEGTLRQHFKEKGQVPNKRGWPPQHFWDRRIRNATALSTFTEREANVVIADPAFNAHYFGGKIVPKEKRALAIPEDPRVAGTQPSAHLIPGVFLVKGRGLLAIRENGALLVLWRLAGSVKIPRDPSALPPQTKIEADLLDTAEKFAARRTQE